MRTSALFGAKNLRFFVIYDVFGRIRKKDGLRSQCGHFSDKRKGVNFSRFCADVFYGRFLTVF